MPGQAPQKTTPTQSSAGAQRCCAHPWGGAFGWKIPSPNLGRPLAWSYDDIFQIILPPKNGYKLFSNKADGGQDDSASCYNSRKKHLNVMIHSWDDISYFFKIKHRCVGTSDFGLRWLSRPSQWCYHVKLHHHGQALRPRSHRPVPMAPLEQMQKGTGVTRNGGHLECVSMDWVRKMLHKYTKIWMKHISFEIYLLNTNTYLLLICILFVSCTCCICIWAIWANIFWAHHCDQVRQILEVESWWWQRWNM